MRLAAPTVFAVVFLFANLLAPTLAATQPDPADLVKMKLFADVSAVEPGKPFTVGIHLKHAPGWHTYWINPGDSGEATRVKFDLPPGFTVGELQFPVPQRIVLPGDIVSFGYEDETMLLATVTPPKDLKSTDPILITAHAEWLMCEKICLPGEGSDTIELRVAEKSQPSAQVDQIARWQSQIPQTQEQANVNLKSMQRIGDGGSQMIFLAFWRDSEPKQVEWFPPVSDDFSFSKAKVEEEGQRVVLSFSATLLPGKSLAEPKTFTSVIAYTDAAGHRRGVLVPFRLDPLPSGKPENK